MWCGNIPIVRKMADKLRHWLILGVDVEGLIKLMFRFDVLEKLNGFSGKNTFILTSNPLLEICRFDEHELYKY